MEGMFLSAEMKYCAVIQIAHRDVSSIDILPLDMRSTVLVCLWNIVRCRLQRERAQRLLFHNEHAEVTTTKDALCQLHLLSAFDICKLTQRLEPYAREGYVRAAQCREAFGDFTGALREVVAALRIDAETSAATENQIYLVCCGAQISQRFISGQSWPSFQWDIWDKHNSTAASIYRNSDSIVQAYSKRIIHLRDKFGGDANSIV